MADKTVRIEVSGPEEIIVPAVEAIARTYGWTDLVRDEEQESPTYGQMIPNPEPQETVVRTATRTFWMEIIKAYNAEQAAKAARAAALAQSDAAIMATTMTLEVVDGGA